MIRNKELTEGRTREATFLFAEEQEAADIQRLIKLSYMVSYTEDDGRALKKEELLRLLVLANGYEMVWCVEECAQALRPLDNYSAAMAYFRTVPEGLMEQAHMHAATREAGNAVAMELGPVESLWKPGPTYKWGDLCANYELNQDVVELPLLAMEAVLRSEELLLKSENYGFCLALWWAMEQEGTLGERQRLFNRLLKSLHYMRMSCNFLASITQLHWVKRSGLLPSIVTRAIWWRGYPLRDEWLQLPRSRVNGINRKSYSIVLRTHFTKTVVEKLLSGSFVRVPLGLLHGFPYHLHLQNKDWQYGISFFSAFLDEDKALDLPAEEEWFGKTSDGTRGFEFTVVCGTVGGKAVESKTLKTTAAAGYWLIWLTAPELVYDAEGKLQVELELQINQHRSC